MGYTTWYTLKTPAELETDNTSLIKDIKELGFDNEMSIPDKHTIALGEWKWYEHMEDMQKLSKKYPDNLFALYGQGEERDDNWVAYFMQGIGYKEYAKIVYPKVNYTRFE